MIYTIAEYALKFPKNGKYVSTFTILRMIANNQLPSNHKIKRGKQYMIEVISRCDECQLYFDASVEYNALKQGKSKPTQEDYERAAGLCVKYDIGATKFFKMHNL